MADDLDIDAMLQRFRERAAAVRQRNLPPVGGDERTAFMAKYKAAAGFAIETLNAAEPTIAPGAKVGEPLGV